MGLCTTSNCKCLCQGNEVSTVTIFPNIRSYTGELYMYSYVKDMELDPGKSQISSLEWANRVRSWVKEASKYHGIPHQLLATILQLENAPNAAKWRRLGQMVERDIQSLAASIERGLSVTLPSKLGQAAEGSTGLTNMKRTTFRMAAQYIEDTYCKPVIPDNVRYPTVKAYVFERTTMQYVVAWEAKRDIKTSSAGSSIHGDLYHCAAHIRELIDKETCSICHSRTLNRDECRNVMARYNGGPYYLLDAAQRYGNHGLGHLDKANSGQGNLYFYAK